jgi:hypothetical protein
MGPKDKVNIKTEQIPFRIQFNRNMLSGLVAETRGHAAGPLSMLLTHKKRCELSKVRDVWVAREFSPRLQLTYLCSEGATTAAVNMTWIE